jgi:YHS domain-containing protein
MSRKTLFLSFALMVSLFTATALAQGQGRGMGMGGNQPQDMKTIHALFDDHKKVTRTVKNIADGVETVTESDDPKVKALIVEHSWAMKARLEKKQPIRQWDPLFAELFKHSDKIKMELTNTAKGVKVTETSTDPYVVKLIQSHAAGVSEFVKEGASIMHKEHPLPDSPKKEEAAFIGKGDGIETCPVTGAPVNKEFKFGFFGRTVYFCCESCLEAAKKNPERFIKP